LKKFKTKDFIVKACEFGDQTQLKIGVKLKKLEVWRLIKDEIENIQDRGLYCKWNLKLKVKIDMIRGVIEKCPEKSTKNGWT
jgi:hypothetical protein